MFIIIDQNTSLNILFLGIQVGLQDSSARSIPVRKWGPSWGRRDGRTRAQCSTPGSSRLQEILLSELPAKRIKERTLPKFSALNSEDRHGVEKSVFWLIWEEAWLGIASK